MKRVLNIVLVMSCITASNATHHIASHQFYPTNKLKFHEGNDPADSNSEQLLFNKSMHLNFFYKVLLKYYMVERICLKSL